jgi:transglutaminase-like putative cysteine protease
MLTALPAALSFGVLAATLPHSAVSVGPVPAWVEARDVIPGPIATPGAWLDLSEDDQLRIDGPRTALYHESIVAVGSREGIEEAAEWEVAFAPTFERVTLHALEVERQGRRVDRLTNARLVVLQPATDRLARIYDDTLTLVVVAADVRIGDRVRFAYTVEGANPVFGGRYHGELSLAWETPVVRRTVRVLHRNNEELRWRVLGPGPQPVVARAGERWSQLRWRLTGFAAPFPEARVPDDWFQEPFVQLSQFPDWNAVVEWARPLYRVEADPEIVTVAHELAPDGSPGERLLAALRFVQDEVRYFAAPVGPASHAPQPAVEVLRRRYGDCKDKARLLVDLLAALGLEAWPAFVATELHAGIQAFVPSPSAFDHVIVAARLAGRTVWIDPTDSLQGGAPGELYLSPFGVALEIRPGVTGLTELPAEVSRPGTHEVDYHYQFGAPGEPARIAIETRAERFQADSLRRTLAGSSAEQLLAGYLDYYRRSGRSLEAVPPETSPSVEDDRGANRMTLREGYRLLDCPGSAPCELLPLLMTEELEIPFGGPRRAPWRLTPDVHLRETLTLHATDRRALPSVPPLGGHESNEWFDFRVTREPRPDGLEIRYELRTLAPVVRVRDLPAYRRAVDHARGQLEVSFGAPAEGSHLGAWLALGSLVAVIAVFYVRRLLRRERNTRR